VKPETLQKLVMVLIAAIPIDLEEGMAEEWCQNPLSLTKVLQQGPMPAKKSAKHTLFEEFDKQVIELNLMGHARNALTEYQHSHRPIRYIGQLVQNKPAGLLTRKNFGRRCLKNVVEELENLGLYLGMDVMGWVPPDQRNL